MAKSKLRKLPKKHYKKLKKDKRLQRLWPVACLLVGIAIGALIVWLQPPSLRPKHLVWAGNTSVAVPDSLVEFLRSQDNCLAPRDGVAAQGVGLWSIYQVERGDYAKIAYGCGVGLTRYVMAVRADAGWQLLPPVDYFAADSAFLPRCEQLTQHLIPKTIEPFCVPADSGPRENALE